MGQQFAKEESQLKALNFSEEELKKLYKNFNKIDKDKSGTLEPEEFFDIPELAQNPLVKRVIAVLDKNRDGNISFLEFVSGLSSLSAGATQEEKLRFAFQIYDINNLERADPDRTVIILK